MRIAPISMLFCAAALCAGCQDVAQSEVKNGDGTPKMAATALAKPAMADTQNTSGLPQADGKPRPAQGNSIISEAPSQGRADTGCAFVIHYTGVQDQPLIRERDGDCKGLDAQFIAVSKLEEMGQLADLLPVHAANIRRSPGGTVFYIEDGATSSAYPLDDENFIYEVVLAD